MNKLFVALLAVVLGLSLIGGARFIYNRGYRTGYAAAGALVATVMNVERCLAAADADYNARWERTCLGLGLGPDCRLSGITSDLYDRGRHEARDECLKRFAGNPW